MKLHLPHGLRRAVMACIAASASLLPSTLCSTVLSGSGVCLLALAASVQATDFDESTANISQITVQDMDITFSYTDGQQIGTVNTGLFVNSMTVLDGVDLVLKAGTAGNVLDAYTIDLQGSVTLQSEGVLNLMREFTPESSSGTLIFDYDPSATTNLTDVLHSSYTGAVEIKKGTYRLSPGEYHYRELIVDKMTNTTARLMFEAGEYTLNMTITGGGASEGVINLSGGTHIYGSISSSGRGPANVRVSGASADNPAVIYATYDAGSRNLSVWNGSEYGQYLEFRGQMYNLNTFQIGNGAVVSVYSDLAIGQGLTESGNLTVSRGSASVAGTVNFYGAINGLQKFSVSDGTVNVYGEFIPDPATGITIQTMTSRTGVLWFQPGSVIRDAVTIASVPDGKGVASELHLLGDIVGTEVTFNLGATVYLSGGNSTADFIKQGEADLVIDGGDVNYTGKLTVREGKVKFGTNDNSSVYGVAFSNIVIDGGEFYITHAAGASSETDVTLTGSGLFHMFDMNSNASEAFNVLTYAFRDLYVEDNANIKISWGGGLRFASLTGSGNLTVEKSNGGSTEHSMFALDSVRNYKGVITKTGSGRDDLFMRIDAVHQDADYSAAVGDSTTSINVLAEKFQMTGEGSFSIFGDLSATQGFSKLGEGSLAIGGSLTVGGEYHVLHDGTLSLGGDLTLAAGTRLRYNTGSEILDLSDKLLTVQGDVYVFSYDFTDEQVKQGVNLGLRDTVTVDRIYALGYTRTDYKLYKQGGYWWLQADTAAYFDADSNDGVWDSNWVDQMPNRPIGDMPTASPSLSASDTVWLSSDKYYSAATMTGEASWARVVDGSVAEMGYVFGGRSNSADSGVVSNDSWIDVVGGRYSAVVGGNDANVWQGTPKLDFEGDTHVQLRQNASSIVLVGGNYKDGGNSTFTGDSYVSVMDNANVLGSVVGGTLYAHGSDGVFDGNSHVFIYSVLADATDVPSVSEDGEEIDTNIYLNGARIGQFVVGGNYRFTNVLKNQVFTGDSEVNIALSGKVGVFGKTIVGGDALGELNNSANISKDPGSLTHIGSTAVRITGAGSVNFAKEVVGGSFYHKNTVINIGGSTLVDINSGIFSSLVIGGSLMGRPNAELTEGDEGVSLITNNVLEGASTIDGDTNVVIRGGTYYGNVNSYVVEYFPPEPEEPELPDTEVDGDGADTTPGETPEPEEPTEPEPVYITISSEVGSIAVVGGSYISPAANVNRNSLPTQSTIGGTTHVQISGGNFYGHIVGASVVEIWYQPEDLEVKGFRSRLSVGGSSVSMTGGSIIKTNASAPRVIGGYLLHQPTDVFTCDPSVTIGDIRVTIGGSARVYDVIGGSWAPGLNLTDMTIEQGNVTMALEGSATVRGDVFAGGIQAGETSLSTQDVSVSIGADVHFDKWDGSATIISSGYLSTREVVDEESGDSYEEVNPYYSLYENESTVNGTRTLTFASGKSYGENLANAYLLNFDNVTLAEGAEVAVRALTVLDSAEEGAPVIEVSGAGTLVINPTVIQVPDMEAAEGARSVKSVRSNAFLHLTEGASLHVLNSDAEDHLSFLSGVEAESGSKVILDLSRPTGGNDTVHVYNGITMKGDSELTLTFNGSASMEKYALIRAQAQMTFPERGKSPVLTLDNTQINFHISYLESDLLTGKSVRLLIAESVEGDFVGGEGLSESLRKWFSDDAEVLIDEYGAEVKTRQLVLRGTTVSGDTADYHSRHAITANGRTGAAMLDNLYTTVNPEATDPNGDRSALLNAMEDMLGQRDYDRADRAMAAAAGSALPTMALAFGDDVDRQLRAIRNRSTTAGLDSDYDYGELPQLSFWVNAEADHHKVEAESTNAGYSMNSWGGTVGMAAEVGRTTSVGLALSAMYGSLNIDSPDKATGHLTTSYLSGYVRHTRGAWSHTLVGALGLASAEISRTVDFGVGSYTAKADANGYAVGLMYELGYSFLLNESGTAVAQPIVNITWRHAQLGGFTENGTDAGLQVDDMKHESIVLGAGVRLQALVGGELYNRSSIIEGRILLKGYAGDRAASADVNFQGAAKKGTVKSVETGTVGVELGAGITIPITTEVPSSIFLDVSAELRDAYTNFNATLGWKASF